MWYDLTWIRRYFHSKRQPRTIFCENNCHFVNLLSFASSSFFLSMRKMKWLNSQQPNTRGHVEHHSISESAQAHEKKEWTTMPLMYIDIPFTFHQIILQVYVHILWPFLSTKREVCVCVWGEICTSIVFCMNCCISLYNYYYYNHYHTKFFTILFQIDENFSGSNNFFI